jgi:F-type H+-transporting ATPase subunit b
MLEIDWTLPVALVSVIIFLVLMNKLFFKPLLQLMEARDKGVRDDLEEAARLRQQAEAALTTYESALGAARRDMTEQAVAVQREQIEQARHEANTLVAEAQATIARETEGARARLASEARELARLVVAKLIGREATR